MTYDLMLNMAKSGIKPRIKVSQYDNEIPQLRITLFDQNQSYAIPSGATVYISGTKKDNTGFQYECTVNDNIITAPITNQMTVFSGDVECEINIVMSGGQKSSENFILEVEKSALQDDVIISETDIPAIQRLSRPATTDDLGVVKVDGTSVTIDEDGTLHSTASGSGTVKSVNNVNPDANGNVTLTASDVNALPSSTTIPDELSDLNDDATHRLVTDTEKQTWNGKSTVSVTQIKTSGEKIATINVDGTDIDMYASAGGGGGGGAVDTVNGIAPDSNGNVTVDADHISDTNTTNKFVTATEKSTWNGKADTSDIPTDLADLTEDSTHRLVTDTEKSTWNGKQDALTFTSTPSASNKVVCVNDLPSGGGSNPNLLDNAWFTVNQRGFTSTTTSPVWTVDRWKTSSFSSATMQLNSNGGITLASASSSRSYIYQPIEDYDKKLNGKTVTISLDIDGTIYTDTKTISDVTSVYYKIWTLDSGFQIGYILQGADKWLYIPFNSDSSTEKSVNVRSVKVEYGTVSTLALDTAPNYTTELLKCQRYYKRFSCPNAYDVIATGMSYNNASARFIVPLSVPMRTTPTMNVVGGFEVVTSANVSYYISSNNPLYMTYFEDRIYLAVACSGISSDGCFLCSESANSYIEFNAELTSVA